MSKRREGVKYIIPFLIYGKGHLSRYMLDHRVEEKPKRDASPEYVRFSMTSKRNTTKARARARRVAPTKGESYGRSMLRPYKRKAKAMTRPRVADHTILIANPKY
jgi:hypothetical protein